jgi:pilus assembly protein CpaC
MKRIFTFGLLLPLVLISSPAIFGESVADDALSNASRAVSEPNAVSVTINGSTVLDHTIGIRRISIANSEIAEAVAVSSTEVVINGKTAGDTSLIVWDQKGARSIIDVHVLASTTKIDAVKAALAKESGSDTEIDVHDGIVFLTGSAKNQILADRAYEIASTLGKVVNLLKVATPECEPQILLKVRFADVDRTASNQLGFNLFTMDATKGFGSSTTGAFGNSPQFTYNQNTLNWSLSSLLNIFYYRPDINLGAVLQDLASRNLLEVLAEPNLLTLSGKEASFLAGGQFPFPTLQGGGSGVGQITIQFKEFGVRLNFLPTVTPRGTIRLVVTPEVSSLDYSNGLSISGYTIPGLATRRVQTEIELESGQSFVIAGLLNNQVTEQLSKMPGLANIPLLGKLFQSRLLSKSNSELLVMVTPEVVRPIPAGAKRPELTMPLPFLKDAPNNAPQNPTAGESGTPQALNKPAVLTIQELMALTESKSPNTTNSGVVTPVIGQPQAIPTVASGDQAHPNGPNK